MNFSKALLLACVFIFSACGSVQNATKEESSSIDLSKNPTTQATLWVQNAAEYKAIAIQTYATALRTLALPLEDSFWTASINQEKTKGYNSLPPAIILDIDETVLDNSPFQARMIKQDKSFNIEDWNAWCKEGIAESIPGAVEFTNFAAREGVTIFYLSNRSYEVEEATRKNLRAEGFPVSDTLDNILTNGEQPGWNSSKIQRRKLVEDNYRVIMAFGDDLNDFLPAKNITQSERASMVEKYKNYFSRRWFMLPNPIYGSWEQALYNFQDDLSDEERKEILLDRLNTKN